MTRHDPDSFGPDIRGAEFRSPDTLGRAGADGGEVAAPEPPTRKLELRAVTGFVERLLAVEGQSTPFFAKRSMLGEMISSTP
jgi:hypothetical protein